LDSWVRFEAQQREAEQADLVKTIQEKVLSDLKDPKMQKDLLAQAVADIEGECGDNDEDGTIALLVSYK
jgi:F-type H+-transporting ATPase subunit b